MMTTEPPSFLQGGDSGGSVTPPSNGPSGRPPEAQDGFAQLLEANGRGYSPVSSRWMTNPTDSHPVDRPKDAAKAAGRERHDQASSTPADMNGGNDLGGDRQLETRGSGQEPLSLSGAANASASDAASIQDDRTETASDPESPQAKWADLLSARVLNALAQQPMITATAEGPGSSSSATAAASTETGRVAGQAGVTTATASADAKSSETARGGPDAMRSAGADPGSSGSGGAGEAGKPASKAERASTDQPSDGSSSIDAPQTAESADQAAGTAMLQATQQEQAGVTGKTAVASNPSDAAMMEQGGATQSSGAHDAVQGLVKELARQQLSRSDGEAVQLQLESETLGPLRVEVTMQDRSLHAAFVTADPAVKLLLEQQQLSLRSALLSQGFQTESFSVSIGQPGGHPGSASSGSPGGSGPSGNEPWFQASDSDGAIVEEPSLQHRLGGDARRGLVDVYV